MVRQAHQPGKGEGIKNMSPCSLPMVLVLRFRAPHKYVQLSNPIPIHIPFQKQGTVTQLPFQG
jgi:hypothetical protein